MPLKKLQACEDLRSPNLISSKYISVLLRHVSVSCPLSRQVGGGGWFK